MGLTEKAEWCDEIYELRESDPVLGGADGISNRQAAQLADRTQWLKAALEKHGLAPNPHGQYAEATRAVAEGLSDLAETVGTQGANLTALARDLDNWVDIAEQRFASLHAPAGTQLLFVQKTAPLGWTKITNHHDKVLRIVSGTPAYGGSVPFTEAFAARSISGSIGSTTLTEAQMPEHGHALTIGKTFGTGTAGFCAFYGNSVDGISNLFSWRAAKSTSISGSSNNRGSSSSHTHSLHINAPDFNVQYVDAIIASKDADQ